ncbi:MAG TPA: lysylphosphatidylglycerol synthase transmembrane domain-containing protein [Bryobacteraceae bacterium]|nr:lysylphosphatidylglycerol synthase transmembrane domain-containing protein [Bryobacteraceae bacterium]
MTAFAVLATIVGIALWRWRDSSFHWNEFAQAFRGLDVIWLTWSIALVLVSHYGRALRWEVMLRPVRPGASIMGLLSATLIGFTAIVILGRAGELVRPYLIAQKARVPFPTQVAAWVLERIYDLLMVLAIFGFALAKVPWATLPLKPGLAALFRTGGWIVGVIAAVCIVLLVAFGKYSHVARRLSGQLCGILPERVQARVGHLCGAFLDGMQSTSKTSYIVLMAVYTVLEWALIFGCYYCLFKAFPLTAGFTLSEMAIFMGVVAFGSVVQIPGVGGGVQVAAVLALTEIFGLPLEPATGMALLIWGVSFLTVVPIGLGLALHEGVNWGKFRELPENAAL